MNPMTGPVIRKRRFAANAEGVYRCSERQLLQNGAHLQTKKRRKIMRDNDYASDDDDDVDANDGDESDENK